MKTKRASEPAPIQPDTWPDGKRRSTNNAFTNGWGHAKFPVATLNLGAKLSANSAKATSNAAARGINRGMIHGLSKKADAQASSYTVGQVKA